MAHTAGFPSLATVVRSTDNAIHRINLYPMDSEVRFANPIHWIAIYLLDSVIRPSYNWTL